MSIRETWVQSQVASYQRRKKMVLDTSGINTQQYKVKWSNPEKGVAPSSTPRCSSYWKGSLLVALDYGRQLYLLHHHHHHHHIVPLAWISLTITRHFSLSFIGLQGYIPYPHIAAVCMFELVVLLLPGHMWGSIGVHHLWARPCFSSSLLHAFKESRIYYKRRFKKNST